MKFLALVIAAQLAIAAPVAKKCSSTDGMWHLLPPSYMFNIWTGIG
jgi:hypothetical protein